MKPVVFMASLPERSAASTTKATEMVSIPDALGSGHIEEATREEAVSQSKHAEAIFFRNGSLKFDLDLSSEGLESTLNKLSKWIVAALFGIAILWKHDAEAMWMGMGSVINALLSNQLKQILNHQRPDPSLRSDPGMPSSHAQSIFYAASYVVISLLDSWGVNVYTTSLATFTVACGVYLSWLRVSQRLHTIAQVSVGAAIGSAFSLGWFFFWRELLVEAFASTLWVKIMVFLLSIGFCLGFLVYVARNWLADEYESL